MDKIYANYVDYYLGYLRNRITDFFSKWNTKYFFLVGEVNLNFPIPSTTEVARKMRCRGVMWDRGIFYSLYVPLNSHLVVLLLTQAKLI